MLKKRPDIGLIQHDGNQYHHRFSKPGPFRDGLGYRHECEADYPGGPTGSIAHAALAAGFQLLTLFSGIGVIVLALISFFVFKPAKMGN